MSAAPPGRPPVLGAFGLGGAMATLVTDNANKPVWRIEQGGQRWFLKRMPCSEGRLRFVVAAIRHLRDAGVPTPPPLETRNGEPFARDGEDLYVLFPAVPGREVDYGPRGEVVAAALGRFHRASRGFRAPPGAEVQSSLGDWPRLYDKKIAALDAYATRAAARPDGEFERAFLAALPDMRAAAVGCRRALDDGRYGAWCERLAAAPTLCHQDFAASNLLRTPDGKIWLIDLDSLTHDLPGRDIRKLLQKLIKKRRAADPSLLGAVLDAYQAENPLAPDEVAITLVDLAFPHLFHGIAGKYFEGRTEDWSPGKTVRRLHEMVAVERAKLGLLAALPR